jgi:tetratricopeptide (TPR) repeat protein
MHFHFRMTNPLVAALIGLFVSGCSSRDIAGDAEAAARSGQYEKAIKLYSQVVNTSDDPGVFGNRGNCYSYTGNLEAALADYQTALDKINARSPSGKDPLLPSIYYNRGYAYNRAKKFEQAIQDFEKTIAIKSDYPDVTNALAWLLATCPVAKYRNPQRAVQLAEVELKRAPENPAVLDTAARVLRGHWRLRAGGYYSRKSHQTLHRSIGQTRFSRTTGVVQDPETVRRTSRSKVIEFLVEFHHGVLLISYLTVQSRFSIGGWTYDHNAFGTIERLRFFGARN